MEYIGGNPPMAQGAGAPTPVAPAYPANPVASGPVAPAAPVMSPAPTVQQPQEATGQQYPPEVPPANPVV